MFTLYPLWCLESLVQKPSLTWFISTFVKSKIYELLNFIYFSTKIVLRFREKSFERPNATVGENVVHCLRGWPQEHLQVPIPPVSTNSWSETVKITLFLSGQYELALPAPVNENDTPSSTECLFTDTFCKAERRIPSTESCWHGAGFYMTLLLSRIVTLDFIVTIWKQSSLSSWV